MQLVATLSMLCALAAPADSPLERALVRAQVQLELRVPLTGDHSSWENAWEIESPHFLIRTTANWYIGQRMAENLEGMLPFFHEVTGSQWVPSEPLRIFLFEDLAGYNTFGDENGEYHSSMLGSYFATGHPEQPVATYIHHSPKQLGMWVTHSAYHQFAARAFSQPVPVWFDEGLASYFANAYWDPAYLAAQFKRIKSGPSYVPLRTLLREPIEAYVPDPHARFIELGMLFNYLLHHREDTMTKKNADGIVLIAPAADFISGMLLGQDVTDNPVRTLLTEDLEQLEADLLAYEF